MDLEGPRVAGDEDRLTDRLEMAADRVDIEAAAGLRLEEVHRLVAEALIGMGDQRGGLDRLGCPAPHRARRRPVEQVQQRALVEAIQTLAARVDDPGLTEDREQARRPGDRPLRAVDRRAEDRLEVVLTLGPLDRRVGRLADHRQDRALDRLGDRAIRSPCALPQGVGEVQAVEPPLAGEILRDATQDLAGDDARVAAGTHQRAVAQRRRDPLGGRVGRALALLESRPDRREHVAAGVSVGDREDVQAVDLVDVGLEVRDGGAKGLAQPGPVARPAGHQPSPAGGGMLAGS